MSTEISGIESEQPESPRETATTRKNGEVEVKPRRSGAALAFLALLFALVALAVTGWMWWLEQSSPGQEEQRLATEISRLDNSDRELSLKLNQVSEQMGALAADDSGAELVALQQRLQAERSNMDRVENALNEQMSLLRSLQGESDSLHGRLLAAEAALTGISGRESDAGGELDVAEVDYLLRLANERLKLFSDPGAADQALAVADMNLAALDNPMYLGVRQDIAAARRQLAAVEIPDYLYISGRLEELQQEMTALPFHSATPSTAGSAPVERDGWWDKVKGVFSNLVTVRRSTDEENQRISLQDKDYIRQGVWLQLEVAQLALMRQDQPLFRTALERVRATLSAWFDPREVGYKDVESRIDELAAIQIRADVPDITAPWSALRLLRSGRSSPVTVAPAETPVTSVEPEQEEEKE